MDETVLIRPRSDASPQPFAEGGSQADGLPLDILEGAVRRLRATMLAIVASITFAIVLTSIMWAFALDDPATFTRAKLIGMLVCLALAVPTYLVTRSRSIHPQKILHIGAAYVVLSGFVIAMNYCWPGFEPTERIRGTSWLVVWVVLFPLLVPGRPGRTLVFSLAIASTMPLALWASVALGAPAPSGEQSLSIVLPTYIAAMVALVPALIVHRMNRDVAQARRLGSYHLEDLLGRGGMGEVWRASHRMLKRPAAVKLIRPEAMGHDDTQRVRETQKRFEREAQVTASLNSPHTVELYDFGRTNDGTFYYVMELLDGVDLQTMVERFGPLPAARVAHLLRQACDSLADAHHVGLVHRDIKPGNIFACRRGMHVDFVKVLDFGLVKPTRVEGEDTLRTAANIVSGTPAYLAPEVAQGAVLDGRADLYSLGCTAFWMLTGQTVFRGENAMQLALKHVQEPPTPPSKCSELDIPEALERIVMLCLEKDPNKRPASASALDELLARTELEREWTPETAERWWRRHRPERRAEAEQPSDAQTQAVS